MPKYTQNRMCAECPFRAISLAGWLGPWTIEDMLQVAHAEDNLICHVDVARLVKKGQEDSQIDKNGQHCVGALRYMTSVCKSSRDSAKDAAQDRLRTIPDQPMIPPFKLREHHEAGTKSLTRKKKK